MARVSSSTNHQVNGTNPFRWGSPFYDVLNRDRNYQQQVRFVNEVLRRRRGAPSRRILDLGCGTGGHAIGLARLGYDVTGIDESPEMLSIARKKAGRLTVHFVLGDISALNLNGSWDAAYALFGVANLLTPEGLERTLERVKHLLRPSGLIILDFFTTRFFELRVPSTWTEAQVQGGRLVRLDRYEYVESRSIIRIHREHMVIKGNLVRLHETHTHNERLYAGFEIERILRRSGYAVLARYRADHVGYGFRRTDTRALIECVVARAKNS
jgi:ubiquinone/menaquinone biosynthesis C-methylase UbiE